MPADRASRIASAASGPPWRSSDGARITGDVGQQTFQQVAVEREGRLLRHVGVGAEGVCPLTVLHPARRGQHDDGQLLEVVLGAQALEQLEPVDDGHLQVDQHEVDARRPACAPEPFDRLCTVADRVERARRRAARQRQARQLGVALVVLDEQHADRRVPGGGDTGELQLRQAGFLGGVGLLPGDLLDRQLGHPLEAVAEVHAQPPRRARRQRGEDDLVERPGRQQIAHGRDRVGVSDRPVHVVLQVAQHGQLELEDPLGA